MQSKKPSIAFPLLLFATFISCPNRAVAHEKAKSSNSETALHTRTYRLDPTTARESLKHFTSSDLSKAQHPEGETTFSRFFQTLGLEFNPAPGTQSSQARVYIYNEQNGLLLVRATRPELELVESALQVINTVGPGISIEAKIYEVEPGEDKQIGFDWFPGQALPPTGDAGSSTVPTNRSSPLAEGKASQSATSILSEPQMRVVTSALQSNSRAKLLGSPSVKTISGKAASVSICESATEAEIKGGLSDAGLTFEVVPSVAADGYTIRLDATVTVNQKIVPSRKNKGHMRKMTVASTVILWDGQTAVLQGNATMAGSDKPKNLIVMITATLIDPTGNRVHAATNLPYDPTKVPEQKLN